MIRLQTPSVCGSHTYGGRCFFITILNKMTSIKNEAGTLLPQAFTFNASDQQVRTVIIDGEPFFVAKDVCDILGISNHKDAVSRLDEDEKGRSVLPTQFGEKEMNLVNESGLYHLIFQSRKPEAKAFRKWVTSEVLPSLRKTGRYEMTPTCSKAVLPEIGNYLNLRKVPYDTVMLDGFQVRTVRHNDVDWYSLNDIHTAFRTRTESSQDARRLLAAGEGLAQKILIFGNTHPAWFVTGTAMQLLISRNKVSNKKKGGKLNGTL